MTTNRQLGLHPTDASLDADAKSVQSSLSELIRLVQFRDRDRICCHDVSVSQCYAMEAVKRSGPLRLGDLATHLYLDKSTTSRIVDGLEAKGYVERRPDPADRRAVLLQATDSGLRLVRRIESELHAESLAVLLGLDPETRRGVIRVLELLVARQARRVEVEAGCCRWRPASQDLLDLRDSAGAQTTSCC